MGSAVSAVFAGRLVDRLRAAADGDRAHRCDGRARRGRARAAVRADRAAGLGVAPALLLGGIGGGLVISPNVTMTLRDVPLRMAGSAGGALQTGQRFGAAIGTATLPALFYLVLRRRGTTSGPRSPRTRHFGGRGGRGAGDRVVDWRREVHRERADAGAAGRAAPVAHMYR